MAVEDASGLFFQVCSRDIDVHVGTQERSFMDDSVLYCFEYLGDSVKEVLGFWVTRVRIVW